MSDHGTGGVGLACFWWSAYTASSYGMPPQISAANGLEASRASSGSVSRSSSSISRRVRPQRLGRRGEPGIQR